MDFPALSSSIDFALEKKNVEMILVDNVVQTGSSLASAKHRCVVFGGYVRDLIACEQFKDIDIAFCYVYEMEIFLSNLTKNFLITTILQPSACSSEYHDSTIAFNRVQLIVTWRSLPTIWFNLDITIGDLKKRMIDFECNTLFIRKLKKGPETTLGPISYQQQTILLNRIQNKVTTMLNKRGVPCPNHRHPTECISRLTRYGESMMKRIEKMVRKGWTIEGLGECTMSEDCIFAQDDVFCKFNVARLQQLEELRLQEIETRRILKIAEKLEKERREIVLTSTVFPPTQKEYNCNKRYQRRKALKKEKRERIEKGKTKTKTKTNSTIETMIVIEDDDTEITSESESSEG
jgi:hypothetical protein